MSGLFGGGGTISTGEQQLAGIQIQTSAYGVGVALVYGRTRVSVNLIHYLDFTAVPHTTSQRAGKGGGGATIQNTTYTYTVAAILGICEGPILKLGRWWRDKDEFASTSEGAAWLVALGYASQSPWGYLQSKHPTEAVGYGSTAYVADAVMDLGSSGSTKNHSFEVWGLFAHPTLGDANPQEIINDFMGNAVHGVGFSRLDTAALAVYGQACLAAGCRLSPAFTEQKSAADHMADMMQATNSNFVWSGGKLKIVPYHDSTLTSSEATYTPNTTPLYDLGPSDFLVSGADDPVKVERKTQADAYNRVQVEFLNSANSYNLEIAEASDQANVEQYGLRTMDPIRLHMITNAVLAQKVAQWILQRALYIRNVYEFDLGPRHMLLEAMDLVTLTDANLGLSFTPVRVVETEEDFDGKIRVKAEEWPFGVATATQFPNPVGTGGGPNTQVPPGNTQSPVIFEPPADLTNGQPEVWIGACGGAEWGGCEIWASRDNASYSKVGTIVNPARMGVTTTSITPLAGALLVVGPVGDPAPAVVNAAGVDISNILGVDLSISGGTLVSASSPDAARYETACYLDGEVLGFQNALLTGANRYSLSSLRRGLYGSNSDGHALGVPFLRLDDAVAKIPVDRWDVGDTIYFKLVSFNRFGQGKQDIATVSAYSYQILGKAYTFPGPTGCSLTFSTARPT